jgi:hypothetical protein
MTREQAKQKMLFAFNEAIIDCMTLKGFVAGFPDEYESFDNELYDMVRELAKEGELEIFKFNVPGENPVEVIFPKGTAQIVS